MEFILNWVLRAIFFGLGAGAALWIAAWFRSNWRRSPERWTVRIAAGMIVLAGVYTAAHVRLLAQRSEIEAARERYAVYGDPRRTEMRRGEVRGWILDCSDRDENALAAYASDGELTNRVYPLGEAGANLIGGGAGADERDYTIERLFGDELRRPRSFMELGELHPAGTDLHLTLCREPTAVAYEGLAATGRSGAVVVQDVRTGAVIAYASTGGPDDPPFGIKQYSPPGSVFKLALAAVWWENGLPDDISIPCPPEIQITPRAVIANFDRIGYGEVQGPTGMLIPSCNTAAVWMAQRAREEIGAQAFVDAYRRYGFLPYTDQPSADTVGDFWRTESEAWVERMTPAPSRIRISEETGPAEWGQLSIGQGPVDVTVIGVSRFIQAIANGGVMLPPTLERELALDPPDGERVMSEQTAAKLMQAMMLVVDQGTARAAQAIIGPTGWDMGGKTGTAQVAGRPDNGWFAGIVFDPQGRPRYTITSMVEAGGGGGGLPTRIAASVARVLAEEEPALLEES